MSNLHLFGWEIVRRENILRFFYAMSDRWSEFDCGPWYCLNPRKVDPPYACAATIIFSKGQHIHCCTNGKKLSKLLKSGGRKKALASINTGMRAMARQKIRAKSDSRQIRWKCKKSVPQYFSTLSAFAFHHHPFSQARKKTKLWVILMAHAR